MAETLEQFVDQLAELGLMTADELIAFRAGLPRERTPNGPQELALELVRAGRLTRYQAAAVWQGKGRGLILGNYVILDRLGAGGMGKVYKARHKRIDRTVALKVLSAKAVQVPDAVRRFHREVRAAARLVHPNVVTAFDADEADGVHFLVMECVDGQDLAARVKKEGPLPIATAVDCIVQAARGLAYAHHQGVVHRDIKPSNLLGDKSGVVKILDMGLARLEDADESGQHSLTQSGQVMGTVDYLSPEQAADTRTADGRADVYSLGCTLYFLLHGRPAYQGPTMMAKVLAHRKAPIPSLGDGRNDVPPALDAVFRRMVAKDPDHRQQTADEVVAELEACLFALHGDDAAPAGPLPSGGRADASEVFDPTLSVQSPHADTDPKTALSINVRPARAQSVAAKAAKGARLWHNPGVVIGAVGLALALIVAAVLGIRALSGGPRPRVAGPSTSPASGETGGGGDNGTAPRAGTSQPPELPGLPGLPELSIPFVAPAVSIPVPVPAPNSVGDDEWFEPVKLGPVVNSGANNTSPHVTSDDLELYYSSDRPGGVGLGDLWVVKRATIDDPWDVAENLGPTVNTGADDLGPALSADGLELLFHSTRTGGAGGHDLWMCTRQSTSEPFGQPVNLGPLVNSNRQESHPELSPDGLTLMYSSDRPGSLGKRDLWIAMRTSRAEPFGAPQNLGPPVNGPDDDAGPALSPDGLQLVFFSDRPGGAGGRDLWLSRRDSESSPWQPPRNVGPSVNTPGTDSDPAFSHDGQALYFTSTPSGGGGIWMSRRKPKDAAAP